jgi:hypothetical protein
MSKKIITVGFLLEHQAVKLSSPGDKFKEFSNLTFSFNDNFSSFVCHKHLQSTNNSYKSVFKKKLLVYFLEASMSIK